MYLPQNCEKGAPDQPGPSGIVSKAGVNVYAESVYGPEHLGRG